MGFFLTVLSHVHGCWLQGREKSSHPIIERFHPKITLREKQIAFTNEETGIMHIMVTELLSGLALFLFGMKFMSESLQKLVGERLHGILKSMTENKYIALLFGAFFTAVIQSSGATTVMEVSFVNAGLMTVEQSVGLTFGANIGTTITSQLVSLKLTAIAPFIIFAGAAIITFGKRPILRKAADVTFGFGALFLGINLMTGALGALHQFPEIVKIFHYLGNPVFALLLGLLMTVVVQSSSVTVSVLVLLADSGLVDLASCVYFILGANVGSCTPAVVSAMHSNKEAKRTALIHVLFNAVGVVLFSGIMLFAKDGLIGLISGISGVGNAKRFVANADTLFKVIQALILLPFTSQMVALSKKMIPEGATSEAEALNERKLLYIGKSTKYKESTAVVDSIKEIERMAYMVRQNLKLSLDALLDDDLESAEILQSREKYVDFLSSGITEYLIAMNKLQLPLGDADRIGSLFHAVIDIERIGDHAVNILEAAQRKRDKGIVFSEQAYREMMDLKENVMEIYDDSLRIFASGKKDLLERVSVLEDEIDRKQILYQEEHVERMSSQSCSVEAGLIFMDFLIGMERIGDHAMNIAYSATGK